MIPKPLQSTPYSEIRSSCGSLPATGPAPKKAPDVDPECEIAIPTGVPQARRRAPRSGAKKGGKMGNLAVSGLDHGFTSTCDKQRMISSRDLPCNEMVLTES